MGKLNLAAWIVVGCALAGVPAHAEYPVKAVRMVVGAPAGDPNDLLARLIAPSLSAHFGHRFFINNYVGAGGNLAAARVAKLPADGQNLLVVADAFSTSVSLYPKLAYHPERDFKTVARLATYDQVLVINSTLGMRSLSDFLALLRTSPGRVAIASAGTGTTSHLAAELMKSQAGWLDAVHVPYRGHPPALAHVLGNHVHAVVATVASAQPHVHSGRLRALAVTTARRVRVLSDVPTFDESGFPGFEAVAWSGVVAPAGTPYDTVVRLNLAMREAMRAPAARVRFAAHGAEPVDEPPEGFAQYLHAEVEKWAKVARTAGLTQ